MTDEEKQQMFINVDGTQLELDSTDNVRKTVTYMLTADVVITIDEKLIKGNNIELPDDELVTVKSRDGSFKQEMSPESFCNTYNLMYAKKVGASVDIETNQEVQEDHPE